MSGESDITVEIHQSEEELILALSIELDRDYAEAEEDYEQHATVVSSPDEPGLRE